MYKINYLKGFIQGKLLTIKTKKFKIHDNILNIEYLKHSKSKNIQRAWDYNVYMHSF